MYFPPPLLSLFSAKWHLCNLNSFTPHSSHTIHACVWTDLLTTINNKQCKRVMKGHSRGVVTIEYSPSQRIIVSAGFDHDILVWSPVAGQVGIRDGENVSVRSDPLIDSMPPRSFRFVSPERGCTHWSGG